MKAVIWTDVLQALIMFVGLLAAIIQGCKKIFNNKTNRNRSFFFLRSLGLIRLGGFGRAFSIASKGGRIEFDRYIFNMHSILVTFFLVFQCQF
jgi:hypothetical protein